MNVRRLVQTTAGMAVIAVAAGACSVATPDPSQKALEYTGGPFSSQNFDSCVNPGVRHVDWPNNSIDYYPVGQRTWDFSNKPGAEAPPIKISTKNQTELYVSGSVTFTWDDSCTPFTEYRTDPTTGKRVLVHEWPGGLAQRFHDTIGRHTGAAADDGGQPQPQGWNDDVSLYIGGPLTIAMNNAALNFNWEQLYNNNNDKTFWQTQVEAQLQSLIDAKTGARHFIVNQVQLGKPELPDQLRVELENNQAATIRATTANTDKGTASNFPGGIAGFTAYQLQLAIAKAIGNGQVKVIPVPTGSIVSVPGQ
jgi:SPFH domain / Band 7 family